MAEQPNQNNNNQVVEARANPAPNVAPNAENRTLREMATANLNFQPMCINFPAATANFELKSSVLNLLPKFHGLPGEDPNKHLVDFFIACNAMQSAGISDEVIRLRAFPLSLEGAAKTWFFYLPSGSITSWNDMQRVFLEKYFPASRIAIIQKQISGIKQQVGETLYEYFERFERLCRSCPNHQLSEQQLIQYFYQGLQGMNRLILDAASGGSLVNKTPAQARTLIETMAINSHTYETRQEGEVKRVHEVGTSRLEEQLSNTNQQLTQLTNLMMAQLNIRNNVQVCGLCSSNSHFTNDCPSLVNGQLEEANAVGFSNAQRRNDPYSNTYNPGWKDHPNLSYGNTNALNFQPRLQLQQRPYNQQQLVQHNTNEGSTSNVDAILQQLADGNHKLTEGILKIEQERQKFEQETRAGMQELRSQLGQLANSVGKIEAQLSGKLPAQPVNPIENVNAITLRTGKVLEDSKSKEGQIDVEEKASKETGDYMKEGQAEKNPVSVNRARSELEARADPTDNEDSGSDSETARGPDPKRARLGPKSPGIDQPASKLKVISNPFDSSFKTNGCTTPFPVRFNKKSKEVLEEDILETFRKVQVNIPLIDAIRQVPRYAKFLKDLCNNKRKEKVDRKVNMNENCSAMLLRKLPPKCKDRGSFSIPCTIGNKKFDKAMCDLGASINVMPYSIFVTLNIGPLVETGVIIQLADRSNVYPEGIVEDVIVQVEELVFPADFYVLKMEENELDLAPIPLLLGRPFLRTAKTKIDVYMGLLTVEFDDHVVRFNIFEDAKVPSSTHAVFSISKMETLAKALEFKKEEEEERDKSKEEPNDPAMQEQSCEVSSHDVQQVT